MRDGSGDVDAKLMREANGGVHQGLSTETSALALPHTVRNHQTHYLAICDA
jgi:hypothetical protein